MTDARRLLIAAALSVAVLILWQLLAPAPPAPAPAPPQPKVAVTPAVVPVAPEEPSALAAVSAKGEERVRLENPDVIATFSNRGAVLTSFVLRHYTDEKGEPLELVRAVAPPAPRPLELGFPGAPALEQQAAKALYVLERPSSNQLVFRYAEGSLAITKRVRLGTGYLFDVEVTASRKSWTLSAGSGLRNPSEKEKTSFYVQPTSAIAAPGGKLQGARADKIKGPESWAIPAGGFAGLTDNYFLAVFVVNRPVQARAIPIAAKGSDGKPHPLVSAAIEAEGPLSLRAYFGPKDLEILESLGLGLERTVDFGWFGILARPLLLLLKWTYSLVHNYGVAILIVTLIIRILLFPLMHKSYSSMQKMAKLAPKMTAIREKYKKSRTDAAQRAKMNQEMMALYQAEGYNPMSGCFPVLLQLPILVAFYNVLSRSIELRHAPFVFWIHDLSAIDRSYVLVILMTITMYIQQAMTPSTADPIQKRMFMAMPLVMAFIFKDVPSGLVLYWLFSNILTILQQMLIKRLAARAEPVPVKPTRVGRGENGMMAGKRSGRAGRR